MATRNNFFRADHNDSAPAWNCPGCRAANRRRIALTILQFAIIFASGLTLGLFLH